MQRAAWIWPFSPETAGEGFPPLPTMSPNEQRRKGGREVVKKQPSWQFVGWNMEGGKGESFSYVLSLRSGAEGA